ncbi:2-amino-4-hydroxy-6-hydroxymethyldihydropteridine diphosphokinase [Paracoccus xiamenensis]|uniref:2-amino-4-hydroxy-6- hydroxymethyldihydropteridine diphosphokinase n=1 Tax=Paracoccus xiamenensis TaxID=2714901 RepID=UPI0014098F8B|nr:2-amino-4-hydroxy-6-hydroxymethyldihydropteridine diphosphokinase [Paracoccus xiamenensis]NHF71725.1 2-amino-4-hydroxy-6-hydroxymethyldihydropteridine diphosphokinase [Paracoccus xiamenensis]
MTAKLALIALGSNLSSSAGSPEETLRHALARLIRAPELSLQAVSRFYATPAFPAGSGPDYVNACALLNSRLPAPDLLALLHRIEADLGRTRNGERWAARGIDLDLLAVEDLVTPDATTQDAWRALPAERQRVEAPDQLILPHPRLQDRAFVLVPLADIAPGWRHPRLGLSVAKMLAALPAADRNSVKVRLDKQPASGQITGSASDLIRTEG